MGGIPDFIQGAFAIGVALGFLLLIAFVQAALTNSVRDGGWLPDWPWSQETRAKRVAKKMPDRPPDSPA